MLQLFIIKKHLKYKYFLNFFLSVNILEVGRTISHIDAPDGGAVAIVTMLALASTSSRALLVSVDF